MSLKIEVFGGGCAKCHTLEKNAREAVDQMNLDADVSLITAMDEIVARGIAFTPGLAINGKIVSTGRVLSTKEICNIISEK